MNENESILTYKSEIKSRIDITREYRGRGLSGYDVFKRMSKTNLLNIKLTDSIQIKYFNKKQKKEKDKFIQLNDNLAKFIQITRFLEIQNKKLTIQIEIIQNAIEQSSLSIKNIYQIEITQSIKILEESKVNNNNDNIEDIINENENEKILSEGIKVLHDINLNQIDSIRKTISQNDADIILFRRRLSDIEDELYQYKIEITKIISLIKQIQTQIQNENFIKIIYQTEKLSLEDQINTICLIHEKEINEIRSKYFSIDCDPSIIFHNELGQLIKQLREEYHQKYLYDKNYFHNQFIFSLNQFNINQQKINFQNIFIKKNKEKQNKFDQQILNIKNKNKFLKIENQHLTNQINQIQILINQSQLNDKQKSNEQLKQIQQVKINLQELDSNYQQIINMNISLENEINTYKHLLQGRNGLQVHVDRIIKGIYQPQQIFYFKIITNKNLLMKKIKDLKKVIFLNTSDSTSKQLKTNGKTILECEIDICKMISYDNIVIWNTDASIENDLSLIKSNGIIDPSSIFKNNLTKHMFNQSDIIIFITNANIQYTNVHQFSSNLKTNFNKILIICIIIEEDIEDYSSIDISIIAPLMFASNILCLLFNGNYFSVILSKGLISLDYPISTNLINLNEIFNNNNIKLYENNLINENNLLLNDDLNQTIYLDFNQFISLNDLNQIILIKQNQWKLIIQYAKINNKLQQLKFFVLTMKYLSKESNLNTIIKQFNLQYLNQKNIIDKQIQILQQNNSNENNQLIIKFQKQLNQIYNQINQEKNDYIQQNIHLDTNYWNQILDIIYQQQNSQYLIKYFDFD